jgi:ribonuclease Z
MVRLIVLGASSLVATEEKRNTSLAFLGKTRGLLVDCGASPRSRLEHLGAGRDAIDDIFITHFHPDHAAGLPLYLMELSLLGRKKPLSVHGIRSCVQRLEQVMEMYQWQILPDSCPVMFHPLEENGQAAVLENEDFRVSAVPVRHVVPTMAVRVDCREDGRSAVYSGDTEPAPELVKLAAGADVLFHEATGVGKGHSSAAQAAEIAREAGVRSLYLIHTTPFADGPELLAAARAGFPGDVQIARDLTEIPWPG